MNNISDEERDARNDEHHRWTVNGPHCIHVAHGLCRNCLDEYLEDPQAWEEFGDHPQGIANWRALEDEIAREQVWLTDLPEQDDDVPF
jgi:hypothetical protein